MGARSCPVPLFVDDGWPMGQCRLAAGHAGAHELATMDDPITEVDIVPVVVADVAMPAIARTRSKSRDHIMQFFAYSDLSALARDLAAPFAVLAERIHSEVPSNPERDLALRSLLDSRDACLRATKARDPL